MIKIENKGKDNDISIPEDGNFAVKIYGDNNKIYMHKDSTWIGELIIFGNDNKLIIGNVKKFYGSVMMGFDFERITEMSYCSIGDNCTSNGVEIKLLEKKSTITIGKDCMFSNGIIMWATDSHSVIDINGNLLNYGHSITIGDHVWVSRNVTFGKNTSVMHDSIIGMSAVVTKKFEEPHIAIGGNPANIIKHNITWSRDSPDKYNSCVKESNSFSNDLQISILEDLKMLLSQNINWIKKLVDFEDNIRALEFNNLQLSIVSLLNIPDADKKIICELLSKKLKYGQLHISCDRGQHIRQCFLLNMLYPYDIVKHEKVRIGGNKDGGYIMIDPNNMPEKIAYSFGISNTSPWDLEMANRGFTVYQYDGTIKTAPDKHPNLFFTSKNISIISDAKNISIEDVLNTTAPKSRNIILQMDIENSEWNIIENCSQDILKRFKQIIVEFHTINIMDVDSFNKKCSILKKILETHIPIHVHFNNYGCITYNNGVFFCDTLEISFFRIDDEICNHITSNLPYHLDAPNNPHYPDIPIRFESSSAGIYSG